MKKLWLLMVGVFLTIVIMPLSFVKASSVTEKLKGRILLQVESKGEAWYVRPEDGRRYYMANGDKAYDIMRNFGVGIKNSDLEILKRSKTKSLKHKGKIFLQVESKGEAYYVDFQGNLHYLKNGLEAFNIMKKLGLGIRNKDLEIITPSNIVNSVVESEKNDSFEESNYYNQLVSLYDEKIKFLTKTIGILNIFKWTHELNAQDEKDSIAFADKIKNESGYDTSFGKNLWQLELEEDSRLIEAYEDAVNQLDIMKLKLSEKLSSIKTGVSNITETEYLLQKNILDSNISENKINNINKDISSTRFFTPERRKEVDEKIVTAAQRDIAELQQEIINIRNEKSKIPVYVSLPIVKSINITPRSINCRTTKSISGSRTVCTEDVTMNSYICNSSKDQYGNKTENCYFGQSNIK